MRAATGGANDRWQTLTDLPRSSAAQAPLLPDRHATFRPEGGLATVLRMDDPNRHPVLLASDEDRERSVELLTGAVVEGRLTLEEFTDRVGVAQSARTQTELTVLTRDLPAPTAGALPVPVEDRHVAFCSSLVRSGPWDLSARSSFRCVFGTIVLDLSQARLAGPNVEIDLFNLFGTVTLLVPDGVGVNVVGGGMFASQDIKSPRGRRVAGAPRLRINVRGPGGTLHVRSP
jgi:hypothetical protein